MKTAPYKPFKGNLFRTIYSLIRLQGNTTRQFLAEKTGLPPTSLNRALDKMMQTGWIEESGLAESTGGRRPNLYCLSGDNKYIICVLPEADAVSLTIFSQTLEAADTCQLSALPEVAEEDESSFDLERLEIWWNYMLEKLEQMLAQKSISLRQVAGIVLLAEKSEVLFGRDESQVLSWLAQKLDTQQIPFKQVSNIESRLYAALWALSTSLDQTMLTLFADHEAIHIGIVQNGLRHCGNPVCINAGTLLSSQLSGDTVGHLERQISQTGILKRFCKIKSNKALTWQDFLAAATSEKRKAVQVLEENSVLLGEIIFNALQISSADSWVILGSLSDELPALVRLTEEAVIRHAEKAGLSFNIYDQKQLIMDDCAKYGAAACLIESLLSEME